MPVDQYIGGIEHAVMHLLYARFFTKVMRDLGLISTSEPFKRLLTQGMVCLEIQTCPNHGYLYPEEVIDEGETKRCSKCQAKVSIGRSEKMSKSKKNTKDPQDYLDRYGADTIRLFSLFAAPPEKDLDWIDSGVDGIHRFLKRIWRFAYEHESILRNSLKILQSDDKTTHAKTTNLRQKTHETIKRATQNFESRFHFNTTISGCMELFNMMVDLEVTDDGVPVNELHFVVAEAFTALTQILAPFSPHISEEFWRILGHENMIAAGPWPDYNESILSSKNIELPIQINSKLRTRISVKTDISEDELKSLIMEDPIVMKWCEGKTIRKIIIIPSQLINVVVN
jgi:leucyl-tRNA synthetase